MAPAQFQEFLRKLPDTSGSSTDEPDDSSSDSGDEEYMDSDGESIYGIENFQDRLSECFEWEAAAVLRKLSSDDLELVLIRAAQNPSGPFGRWFTQIDLSSALLEFKILDDSYLLHKDKLREAKPETPTEESGKTSDSDTASEVTVTPASNSISTCQYSDGWYRVTLVNGYYFDSRRKPESMFSVDRQRAQSFGDALPRDRLDRLRYVDSKEPYERGSYSIQRDGELSWLVFRDTIRLVHCKTKDLPSTHFRGSGSKPRRQIRRLARVRTYCDTLPPGAFAASVGKPPGWVPLSDKLYERVISQLPKRVVVKKSPVPADDLNPPNTRVGE
jgi:hypothetical protein